MIAAAAGLVAAGCGEPPQVVAKPRPADPSPPSTAAPAPLAAHPARRCSECHETYFAEWSTSSHAQASRSPVYQSMRARAPDAAACDRCHAPLAAALGRADAVADEGVTCDVCHTIADVAVAPAAAAWSLRLAENRKYGPICDAAEPYFHRAGCSPLHAESRLCAACHHLQHAGEGDALLPVFSEFEEWQHGPAMTAGVQCQGCHMPDRDGLVASGGAPRSGLARHGDGPAAGDAVRLEARVFAVPDGLVVRAGALVSGAPHALPVGLPGRELAVVAELVDETGTILARDEATFRRVLLDAAGREAPFFAAVRAGDDTRLQPGARRDFELRLPTAPPGARVELSLERRALSAALAEALEIARPPAERLLTRRFAAPWEPSP